MLVTSLILQRLDYCNSVLAGLPVSSIRPLQRAQNAAARLVLNTHHSSTVQCATAALAASALQNTVQDRHIDAPHIQ